MIFSLIFHDLAVVALIAGAWLGITGLLSVIGFIAGITMIVMVITKKPALRLKVSEAGIDAEGWAKPLDAPLRKTLVVCGSVAVATILLGTTVLFVGPELSRKAAQTDNPPSSSSLPNATSSYGYGQYANPSQNVSPSQMGGYGLPPGEMQQPLPQAPVMYGDGTAQQDQSGSQSAATDIDLAAAEKKDRAERQAAAKAQADEYRANSIPGAIADGKYTGVGTRRPSGVVVHPAGVPTPFQPHGYGNGGVRVSGGFGGGGYGR